VLITIKHGAQKIHIAIKIKTLQSSLDYFTRELKFLSQTIFKTFKFSNHSI
jgi:hypothetical protein